MLISLSRIDQVNQWSIRESIWIYNWNWSYYPVDVFAQKTFKTSVYLKQLLLYGYSL